MTALYSTLWPDKYGIADDGTWAAAISIVPDDAIKRVLASLLTTRKPFPPNLPEFMGMCMREMGLPDARPAYIDATNRKWSHPVVYETARRVGVYEVRNLAENQILPTWERVFAEVCTQWMSGERFQVPDPDQVRIGDKTVVREKSPEVAQAELNKMRKMLGALK